MKLTSFLLVLLSLAAFVTTLQTTRSKIGRPFPGYLTFKNGVVGFYYVPTWSGLKQGMSYEERIPPREKEPQGVLETDGRFSNIDYLLIVLLPAVSGLFFVLFGCALCYYLPAGSGRLPLLFFHFLAGNYMILSPEAHLTYRLFYLHLGFFTFIPAAMIHFSLLFPERLKGAENRILQTAPYLASGLLFPPYLYFFLRNPPVWVILEYVVLFYLVGAYLFWLVSLWRTLQKPYLEFSRVVARYLLLGQVLAFLVPLGAAVVIFVGGVPFPLNLALPLTLLFPISIFIGILLARLRQSQMQLVQTEKWVALGGLLSGLAHEINNPMTFVYSNIEPLRELLQALKKSHSPTVISELESLADNIEEGATRAKGIIDNFRYFSYPGRRRPEAIDINRMIDQSINLLRPKWKDRITVVRNYGAIPTVQGSPGEMGQVFVNLLSNACDAIQGNGTIEVATEEAAAQPPAVKVRIRDTGCGIPKSEISRIFDPFYTTKAQGEGTGLGLAITIQIVKSHKGKIDVDSQAGKGTEFVMTLPCQGEES